MIISLIGLSGCGKSTWAERLVDERGFRRFCCDDMIEERLHEELFTSGINGIRGVAFWMGQPYEQFFPERQSTYLTREAGVIAEIVQTLALEQDPNQNIVIDTTGSFIYLDPALCQSLRKHSTLVYLQVPENDVSQMFRQYLADPKPVVWKDQFNMIAGESNVQALSRCYPRLIESRIRLYESYADIILPVPFADRATISTDLFLEKVNDAIRQHKRQGPPGVSS